MTDLIPSVGADAAEQLSSAESWEISDSREGRSTRIIDLVGSDSGLRLRAGAVVAKLGAIDTLEGGHRDGLTNPEPSGEERPSGGGTEFKWGLWRAGKGGVPVIRAPLLSCLLLVCTPRLLLFPAQRPALHSLPVSLFFSPLVMHHQCTTHSQLISFSQQCIAYICSNSMSHS